MKHILLLAFLSLISVSMLADNNGDAKKILDKVATVVGNKSGVQASFSMNGERLGQMSGTIAVKGNKFSAKTVDAVVWYDGKTQWTYVKNTDEVNVTTPTKTQQAEMNPLTFINLYKTGYNLSLKTLNGKWEVHMMAQNANNSLQELYVIIDKSSYVPSQVRLRKKNTWITINISDFKATPQNDATFVFNAKDFPTAEVIDLR